MLWISPESSKARQTIISDRPATRCQACRRLTRSTSDAWRWPAWEQRAPHVEVCACSETRRATSSACRSPRTNSTSMATRRGEVRRRARMEPIIGDHLAGGRLGGPGSPPAPRLRRAGVLGGGRKIASGRPLASILRRATQQNGRLPRQSHTPEASGDDRRAEEALLPPHRGRRCGGRVRGGAAPCNNHSPGFLEQRGRSVRGPLCEPARL
jgi:hypothetical protein